MGSLGFPELIIIMVIALMVFGPRRLPELGKAVGQTMKEFKKGMSGLHESLENDVRREQTQSPPTASSQAPVIDVK